MPHPFPHLPRCGCLAAIGVAFSPGLLHAQSTSDAPTPVVITGNPLRSTDVAAPTNVLSGESLVLRRGATLGETLDRMPGVSSSYFGPNANRPVIRGQDSDRIRILSNSGVALDAYASGQVILTQAARRPPFFRKRSTSGAGAVRRCGWPGASAAAQGRP